MIYDGNSFRLQEYKAWTDTAEKGDTLMLLATDNLYLCQRVAIYRDTSNHHVNIKIMNVMVGDHPRQVVDLTYNGKRAKQMKKQSMLTRYITSETHGYK